MADLLPIEYHSKTRKEAINVDSEERQCLVKPCKTYETRSFVSAYMLVNKLKGNLQKFYANMTKISNSDSDE